MRELNSSEIEHVSGAGFLADMAGNVGSTIGNTIDAGAKLLGLTTDAKTHLKTLGQGIGNILESDYTGAISNISSGVLGIIKIGMNVWSQIRSQ